MTKKHLLFFGIKGLFVAIALFATGSIFAVDFTQQKIVEASTAVSTQAMGVIDVDSNLWVCGYNNYYILGTGDKVNLNKPTKIGGTTKFTHISMGYQHALAIDAMGNIWAWGTNTYGRCGDNSTTDITTPKKITSNTVYTAISANMYNSMALDANGQVWCWGRNNKFQIGNNAASSSTNVVVPTKLTVTDNSATVSFKAISAGTSESFAIDTNGNIWAWGDNANYGLGFTDPVSGTVTYKVPVKTNFGGKTFKAVSAGDSYAMALDTDGNIWTWGTNELGQLGNGKYAWHPTSLPSSLAQPITTSGNFKAIKAGTTNGFAIDVTGKLYAWGDNNSGNLSLLNTVNHYAPEVVTAIPSVSAICPSQYFTAAIDNQGRLYTWGRDTYGQLGDGDTAWGAAASSFTELNTALNFTNISVGSNHVIATTSNSDFYTWGQGIYAQTGTGSFANLQTPTLVPNNNKGFKKLSNWGLHNLAIDANNQLWAWGYNRYGECGQDTLPTMELTPKMVTSKNDKNLSIASYKFIANGDYRSFAIDNLDRLWVFGQSTNGALGTGGVTSLDTLHQVIVTPDAGVTNIDKFSFASSGSVMSFVIDLSGKIWAAGKQDYGQIGNGIVATTNQSTFVPLNVKDNGVDVVFVSASSGSSHTLALDNHGNVWAWGRNNYGQLGSGTLKNDSLPRKVLDGSVIPYTSVLARGSASFAINANNKLFGWGYTPSLGTGVTTAGNTLTPIAIMSDKNFIGVYGSSNITLAQETTGKIYLTGTNSNGELGNGMAWQSTPTVINTNFVPSAVNEINSDKNLAVYGVNGAIVVCKESMIQSEFVVYNLLGAQVKVGKLENAVTSIPVEGGIYIVKIGDFAFKVTVK